MINVNKRKLRRIYRDAKKWRLKEAVDYYKHEKRNDFMKELKEKDKKNYYHEARWSLRGQGLPDLIEFSMEVINKDKVHVEKLEKVIMYKYLYVYLTQFTNIYGFKNNNNLGGYKKHFVSELAFILSSSYIFGWKRIAKNMYETMNKENLENEFVFLLPVNRVSWFIFRMYAKAENREFNIGELEIKNIDDSKNSEYEYHPDDMGELWDVLENWDTEDEKEVERHIEILARDREENYLEDPFEAAGDEYEFVYFPGDIFVYLKARKERGLKNPEKYPYELMEHYNVEEMLKDREPYKETEEMELVRDIIRPLVYKYGYTL